eukprot:6761559-Prorocentrum_lima.AAC.1
MAGNLARFRQGWLPGMGEGKPQEQIPPSGQYNTAVPGPAQNYTSTLQSTTCPSGEAPRHRIHKQTTRWRCPTILVSGLGAHGNEPSTADPVRHQTGRGTWRPVQPHLDGRAVSAARRARPLAEGRGQDEPLLPI